MDQVDPTKLMTLLILFSNKTKIFSLLFTCSPGGPSNPLSPLLPGAPSGPGNPSFPGGPGGPKNNEQKY